MSGMNVRVNLKLLGFQVQKERSCKKKNRKVKIRADLKKDEGPFTCAQEFGDYMDMDADEEKKQLKNEVIYTRDLTRLILVAATLFQIMKADSDGK